MSALEVIPHTREYMQTTWRLKKSVRIYLVLVGAIATALAYSAATAHVYIFIVVAFLIGLGAGMIYIWKERTQTIVSRLNLYGSFFLLGYVVFSFGSIFVGSNVFTNELIAFLNTFIGAAILGRGYAIRGRLAHALEEKAEDHTRNNSFTHTAYESSSSKETSMADEKTNRDVEKAEKSVADAKDKLADAKESDASAARKDANEAKKSSK